MKVRINCNFYNYNFYDYGDHTEMGKINDEKFKNDNRNYVYPQCALCRYTTFFNRTYLSGLFAQAGDFLQRLKQRKIKMKTHL